MRVLSSSAEGHEHTHTHSHSHSLSHSHGASSAVADKDTSALRARKSPADVASIPPQAPDAPEGQPGANPSLKLSAYLNLFGDFTHNITDGLAMAASFYSSPALGAVTTIATFCHEIPHEVSSLLDGHLQS